MQNGTCTVCGKEFTYLRGKKFTCSPECQAKRNRQMTRKRQEKANQPKPAKKDYLLNDALLAKEKGMSYGQYMARKREQTSNFTIV